MSSAEKGAKTLQRVCMFHPYVRISVLSSISSGLLQTDQYAHNYSRGADPIFQDQTPFFRYTFRNERFESNFSGYCLFYAELLCCIPSSETIDNTNKHAGRPEVHKCETDGAYVYFSVHTVPVRTPHVDTDQYAIPYVCT
jgi:hypothetical protein